MAKKNVLKFEISKNNRNGKFSAPDVLSFSTVRLSEHKRVYCHRNSCGTSATSRGTDDVDL